MKSSITLNASGLQQLKKGHPWIFPNAIASKTQAISPGDWVILQDEQQTPLAIGAYNPHSLYRVRVLGAVTSRTEVKPRDLILSRLESAILLRKALMLPHPETTAYRVFNSEADGLSGLTIDRFNQTLVVSCTALWVYHAKALIMDILQDLFREDEIIWHNEAKPLKQDGIDVEAAIGAPVETVIVEGGVRFKVDFAGSQKTGMFIDQRENHERIGRLARGKSVLDLYSYSGGFALHAAKNGASYVKAVDSSQAAIDLARQNEVLNGLSGIEWVRADARKHLQDAASFDIVVLDPPKLVPSKRHLEQAKNYYRYLHREIFSVMKKGSLLMTCNCSSALSSTAFAELVYQQARAVGRDVRVHGVFGPASCHPILPSFKEGQYLTAILVGVI